MTGMEEAHKLLDGTSSPAQRTLYFCALLGREAGLKDGLIVVGGSAIEIYSGGAYVSGDLDVVGRREALEHVLRAWGFHKDGRIWWSEGWKIALDIVSSQDYHGRTSLLRTIDTPFGRVRVAAVEDLIIGRLASTKHWKLPEELNQAILLVAEFGASLDREYLELRAKKEDVGDLLPELLARAARVSKTERTP
ncbi:MAG: hypothetical protein KGJ23_12200 [Euryarchaeota archaeon]|nr:hypothetical protein [Euryarchaeota archaeon]MDE1837358.1 hypothetical protein [Euryarchaeota archaeon]MDE1881372.1 hypothetical protein [Euryarchaeota archaeon]MDE2045636.1 hypothetical protein [Thermoplasmata archaeon]